MMKGLASCGRTSSELVAETRPTVAQRRVCGTTRSGPASSASSHLSLVKFLCGALLVNYIVGVSEGCPLVCICKWKSGKQTVECENQNLSALPLGIDGETQVLNISGNRLEVLPRDAFQKVGLLNLQRIYVRNSRLRQIDPGAFNELINLVEIDLSDNLLTSVPSTALKPTPFLRELNLAGNPLVQIGARTFEFATQLVKLDLSRSQLVRIDDSAFTHLQLLESLKITSNQLTTLSNYSVKSLAQLHGVELHDNPWDCDCRLRDLKLWIDTRKIPHPVSPTCHTPTRLAGKRFLELSAAEFACPPKILLSSADRHVQVYEGENATMECSVDSFPVTNIQWFSQRRLITNNMGISAHRKFFITQDEEFGRSVLTLTNALEKDSGEFSCLVVNAAGSAEGNFSLEVLGPPPYPFPTLDTSHILFIALGLLGLLLLLSACVIITFWRRRARRRTQKPPEILATSTPNKPPRINYDINPGSLVPNGYSKTKAESTDNPDLILETNNSGSYQETGLEEQSSNSELNWEQQSYRNLGYSTEYPPDYGLPIILENSVYSENASYYVTNALNSSNHTPLSHAGGGSALGLTGTGGGSNGAVGTGSVLLSGVWNKNKVGTRIIRAPSARDSPDEGYQEGYCGTDV